MTWRDSRRQVIVYMGQELHDELKKIASSSGQSVNNTILKLISTGMGKIEQQEHNDVLDKDKFVDLARVFQEFKVGIYGKLELMEASILKELGFQGTESLKDRDAIKEEMSRLSRKLDMRLR